MNLQSRHALPKRAPQKLSQPAAGPACYRLNPLWVVPSRWLNRIQEAYRDEAFMSLCADIRMSGGNVIAIKVRPMSVGASNTNTAVAARYEIVYGHRRHRACLQLGLPVKAIVESVDDKQLIEEMHSDDSQRSHVSAYEAGRLYRQLLDEGVYSSMRHLALSIRRNVADVSRAIALAALPTGLIDAMTSPRELALHDAAKFSGAIARDSNRAVEIATALASKHGPLKPKELLRAITVDPVATAAPPSEHEVTQLIAHGRTVGEFRIAADGTVHMTLQPGLPRTQLLALRCQVQTFVKSLER